MGEDSGAVSAAEVDRRPAGTSPALPDDPQALRVEIERTRQDLGDTVAALAEKTDVKARAKEKVADVRHTIDEKRTDLMGRAKDRSPEGASSAAVQVRTKAEENPVPTAALAAFVGGFLFGRITKRRQ
jgi:ElaB/YqjD/DUF883 family membrane-anchored ribosome-binding protein